MTTSCTVPWIVRRGRVALAPAWLRAGVLVLATVAAAPARQLDYRTWYEGGLGMARQAIRFDEARLYVVGESSTPGIQQTAMLISEDPEVEDAGTKNAVLFECGMHAREWFPAETCYWLIDHLLRNRDTPEVQDLLAHVDVWVIPQTNPAGRDVDDLAAGDPTQFAYVCDVGANAGDACAAAADCPGGDCWTEGWRANADTADCGVGVDLARNFSSGWDRAPALCTQRLCKSAAGYTSTTCTTNADCAAGASCKNVRMQYRGPTPFSEPEALNLRRFVHNHMLSVAAVVHANSHELHHLWYDTHDPSAYVTDELLALNAAGSAAYTPNPSMVREGVGGSYGQFSGWLAGASDVAGEPDLGTQRNISTFYLELPVKSDIYGSPYRHSATDTSNSFHPSSDTMEDLWEDAIRDMYLDIVRQARSPQCPVDASGTPMLAECEARDFGLVGAKIADAADAAGRLDYDASTREETLPAGTRRVVFAVQNFSASANAASTTASVTFTKNGSADGVSVLYVPLALGARSTHAVSHAFSAGAVYEVRISLASDDFASNDTKVFRFRAVSSMPGTAVVPGWSRVRLNTREEEPGADDSLRWRGRFVLGREVHPDTGGVEVLLRGRGVHAPGMRSPGAVGWTLATGSPWWDRSKPEKGRWVYSDREGLKGPVRLLRIRQRVDADAGSRPTNVALEVHDADLGGLAGSRAYTVDLGFPGDGLRLGAVAGGERPSLLPKALPPQDGTEDEPHLPPQQ